MTYRITLANGSVLGARSARDFAKALALLRPLLPEPEGVLPRPHRKHTPRCREEPFLTFDASRPIVRVALRDGKGERRWAVTGVVP